MASICLGLNVLRVERFKVLIRYIDIITADNQVKQGAKASTATTFIYFFAKLQPWRQKGL